MTRCRWTLLFVVILAVAGALRAAGQRRIEGDFLRYHRAGRLVASGAAERLYDHASVRAQEVYAAERPGSVASRGDRLVEMEFKYAPAFAVLMAPLGALHPRTAWIAWGAWNGALLALILATAWDYAGRSSPWPLAVVPLVALVDPINDNQKLGQINPTFIAAATVAVWALDRGRDRLAGAIAAVGGAVKFYPALLAIYFAWKRRPAAAVVCAGGTLVLLAGLPTAALGPARAMAVHRAWWDARAEVYAGAAPADVPGHSVKSFAYRVFGGTHYRTTQAGRSIDLDVGVARIEPRILQFVVLAAGVALLAAALWASRGPLRTHTDPRGPMEAGTFLCAVLLASPEARGPHFLLLAIPLTALASSLMRRSRARGRAWFAAAALAAAGTFLLVADTRAGLDRDTAALFCAYCSRGWATAAILTALVLLLRTEREHASPAVV